VIGRMNCNAFIEALRAAGVTHVVGLPDTETGPVFEMLRDGGPPVVVPVCREGEAPAIAAGLWAAGARPIVLIQSTGLFEAGDSLRSIAQELDVPLDLVIGHRGESGKLNAGYADTATDMLEPTLRAWRIPFIHFADTETFAGLATLLREADTRAAGVRAILLPQ
jgi:sulfopyruvate decarboxylase subunit alpha